MEGVANVVRRFPPRGQSIRKLALASETFRSICSDFAAAEAALLRFSGPSSSAHEGLRREYEVLVDELMAEISDALDKFEGCHKVKSGKVSKDARD